MANFYERLKSATTPLMDRFKNPKGPATYERQSRVADGGGGFETAWASQGSFEAIVIPASGTEQVEAQRLESQVSHKILALYDEASGVTAKDRIVFDGRLFNVEFVGNIAEGDMWIKFMCMENGEVVTPQPPVVSCAYPLDATLAEEQAAGSNAKLSMSADEQTGTFTVTAGLASYQEGASPTGVLTQESARLDFSEGKTAIELQIINHPAVSGGAGNTFSSMILFEYDFSASFSVQSTAESDGTFSVQAGGATVLSGLVSAPNAIGIVRDAVTGDVYARIAGVNYSATSLVVESAFALIVAKEQGSVDVSNAGNQIVVRLETNAGNFLGSYEAGTTDPCGNAI